MVLIDDEIFNYQFSTEGCLIENIIEIWISRFRTFTNRANLASDKFRWLKWTHLCCTIICDLNQEGSYTPKDLVDEIQNNRSYL